MDLFFAKSRPQLPPTNIGDIYVWPVEPGWNDFGYGYQAEGILTHPQKPIFNFRLFVIPWRNGAPAKRFNIWLAEVAGNRPLVSIAEGDDSFLSILRGDGYIQLNAWCGGDMALREQFLRRTRDLVRGKVRGDGVEEINAFLKSESAAVGVFRDATSYLSLHRGWRFLIERDTPPMDDALQNFSYSCQLVDFPSRHALDFTTAVSAGLPARCHALIGRNGVGKSRFLREIIFAIAQKAGVKSTAFSGGGGSTSTGGELALERGFGRVVSMAWDAHSGFPRLLPLNEPFEYQFYSMVGAELSVEAAPTFEESITSMTIQVLRDRGAEGMGDRLAVLRESLRGMMNLEDIALHVPQSGWHSLESIAYRGEQSRLELLAAVDLSVAPSAIRGDRVFPFSSGQRTFFTFAVRMAAVAEVGTLILLDEPETHLHPNMIVAFMKMLHQGLEQAKSIAIISTHSPFVARELPSSCVHVIELDEQGRPEIKKPYLRTLGASVDRLAMDIFGDFEQRAYYEKIALRISSHYKNIEEVVEVLGPEISFEMLTLIREQMEGRPDVRD